MPPLRLPLAALAALAFTLGPAAVARADRAPRVFPFTGVGLDADDAAIPAAMAKAIARELHAKMMAGTVEDAVAVMGCDPEQTACLDSMMQAIPTQSIVFGTVTRNLSGKLKVLVTRYTTGEDKDQQSYVIKAQDPDRAVDELVAQSSAQFGVRPERGNPVDPKHPASPRQSPTERPPTRVDDPVGGPHTTSGITDGTYALIGVGGAATAVGIGFIVSARSIRNQVNGFDPKTRQDFDTLHALERAGAIRAGIGYGLIGGGLLLGVYGIYRAVHEREPPQSRPASTTTDLTINPTAGGAVLVFSGRFR